MKLLVDIGNTRLKWSEYFDGRRGRNGACVHAGNTWASELLESWKALPEPDAVWVSSVASMELRIALAGVLDALWGLEAVYVRTEPQAFGVSNAYAQYERLGCDRWVVLVAAHHLYDGDVGIIDCGTAVTVDVLLADGRHQGGLIMPGLEMMRNSLISNTSGIQADRGPDAEHELLARGTPEAVAAGTLYMLIASIERLTRDLQRDGMTWLLTGGDAEALQPLLTTETVYEPHLVLKGLAVMAEQQ